MKRINSSIFFIPLLLIFFACKKQTTANKSRAEELNVEETRDFDYLKIKGKASYNHKNTNFSSKVTIRIKEDEIIWMSFQPFMGIEAIRCKITRDSVQILNRLKNQYYKYGINYFKRKYHINLSFDHIQSILLGNLIRTGNGYKTAKKGERFHLQQKEGPVSIDTYVNRKNQKIEEHKLAQRMGKNSMTIDYSDFKKTNGYSLSHDQKIDITSFKDGSQEKRNVSFNYKNVDSQEEPLNFPFSVPDKYERKGIRR